VIYHANETSANRERLFSVPIDGSSAATRLHPEPSGDVSGDFELSGSNVLFLGQILHSQ
jgi:hypothetical protein